MGGSLEGGLEDVLIEWVRKGERDDCCHDGRNCCRLCEGCVYATRPPPTSIRRIRPISVTSPQHTTARRGTVFPISPSATHYNNNNRRTQTHNNRRT